MGLASETPFGTKSVNIKINMAILTIYVFLASL